MLSWRPGIPIVAIVGGGPIYLYRTEFRAFVFRKEVDHN